MDEPPGGKLSTNVIRGWGAALRKLRGATTRAVDQEPKWRKPGSQLLTGAKRTW
jgi:hydrogenase small subunit